MGSSSNYSNRQKLLENHGLHRQLTSLPLHRTQHRPSYDSSKSLTNRTCVYSGDNRTFLIRLPTTRNLQDQWRTYSEILEERGNAGGNERSPIHCTGSLPTSHDPIKRRDHLDGIRSSVHFHNSSRSSPIQLRPQEVPKKGRS